MTGQKKLCFWKQETGKRLELVHLVGDLGLLHPQRGAEFDRTWCIVPVIENGSYHASFIIWAK